MPEGSDQLFVNARTGTWEQVITSGIADGAVTTPKLADDAVTTQKIADGAVTNAKLADMIQLFIKARKSAGAGPPEDCTIGEVLDFITSASAGNIIVRTTATGVYNMIVPGTAGQVLTSNGLQTLPTFQAQASVVTPSAVLLASATITATASNITIPITSYLGYRAYEIQITKLVPVTDDVELWMRFSTDGGATFITSTVYSYAGIGIRDASTALQFVQSAANSRIVVAGAPTGTLAISNVTAEGGVSTNIKIFSPGDASFTGCKSLGTYYSATGETIANDISGMLEQAQDTDAFQILFESGNIISGYWALYGYN